VIRTFAADQQFSAIQYDGTIYTSARHLHRRDSVTTTITYKVGQVGNNTQPIPDWQTVVATYRALGEIPRMDKIRVIGAVLALVLAEHDDTQA